MISSREEVQQLQQEVKEVEVADDILRYITLLVEATRQNDKIQLGVSREEHWHSTTWQKHPLT